MIWSLIWLILLVGYNDDDDAGWELVEKLMKTSASQRREEVRGLVWGGRGERDVNTRSELEQLKRGALRGSLEQLQRNVGRPESCWERGKRDVAVTFQSSSALHLSSSFSFSRFAAGGEPNEGNETKKKEFVGRNRLPLVYKPGKEETKMQKFSKVERKRDENRILECLVTKRKLGVKMTL